MKNATYFIFFFGISYFNRPGPEVNYFDSENGLEINF